ncbi:MAG: hypothetical protein H6817_05730 [Phycisphaerales bacterium]|nr:hypothetical protein [Phycisphaerales bacterium]
MRSRIAFVHVAVGVLLICAARSSAGPVAPGTVIFDFNINTNGCDPDNWNFFGTPTTDFGPDPDAQDGHGAYHSGNWLIPGGPFLGQGVGIGPFAPGQPLCGVNGSGIADIDLDLSLATALTIKVRLELPEEPPFPAGTAGVRMQFQLIDSNALLTGPEASDTVAVLPGDVPGRPWVDRRIEPGDVQAWETFTIPLAGLDAGYDVDAVAGDTPFDLSDIKAIRMIWRPGPDTTLVNVIHFDEITAIDDPVYPWGDSDHDADVDLADFGKVQECYGVDLTPTHPTAVVYDFESGDQGWGSFGPYSTDSGLIAGGSSGQGRYHIADFDLSTTGFGIVDTSPLGVDLSAYTGLSVDVRMLNVPGETAFGGQREFDLALGIGEKEFIVTDLQATTDYQTFAVNFYELAPQPTIEELSDPNLEIKLIVRSDGKSGVLELDYDQVTGIQTVQSPCLPLDANRDGAIDTDDMLNFQECLLGPGVTDGFYPWCY